MKDRKSPFFAFRYLVTPTSTQISMMHELSKKKEDLVIDIIDNFVLNKRTEWNVSSKKYLIYGFQKRNSIYILKYARESLGQVYIPQSNDIDVETIIQAKFVYLIIDTKSQIILIERNTSVFGNVFNSIDVLRSYFVDRLREYDYMLNIHPINSRMDFWSYIDEADEIYEFSILLNAPNMALLAGSSANEVLKEVKELTNNDTLEITTKSKDGKLKVAREVFDKWIGYVVRGGGRYLIRLIIDGTELKRTSEDNVVTEQVKRKKDDQYTDGEIDEIQSKIDTINSLGEIENKEDEKES